MITYFTQFFRPNSFEEGFSLAIQVWGVARTQHVLSQASQLWAACVRCQNPSPSPPCHQPQGGREGARLTHNHERQYAYVLQSLTLWREISTDMFRLWYLAEEVSGSRTDRRRKQPSTVSRMSEASIGSYFLYYSLTLACTSSCVRVCLWPLFCTGHAP